MPFMQTDLQKIMGMEFSEDKIQYLVYQMLKGLKVGRVWRTVEGVRPEVCGRPGLRAGRAHSGRAEEGRNQPGKPAVKLGTRPTLLSLPHTVHPLRRSHPQGECFLCNTPSHPGGVLLSQGGKSRGRAWSLGTWDTDFSGPALA